MKFIRQNFIPIFSIAILMSILLAFILLCKGESGGIYIQCLIAVVILFFGYFTYRFQKETNEFNRISRLPALNVNRDSIEKEKVIEIENISDYPAKKVYIGSFLSTDTGDSVQILYDEIQQQITKFYPIQQSDVLKPDFREKKNMDLQDYILPLKQRIEEFVKRHPDKVYLVIALRNYLMKEDETLFFFYKCKGSTSNIDNLGFQSEHFSTREGIYKNCLKEITKQYEEHRSKYE